MAGSAVIGALRVNLGIDTAAFTKGLASAQKELAAVGKRMQSVGKQMSVAITVPTVALGASITKTAGSFEASMNRVQAATKASADQFGAMRKLAMDLGATTQFAASEAADSIETLAKNGLGVSDILGGAATASLDLAAATGSGLANAADIATDVMANFGKTAADMGGVVDGITGTLFTSKFGIDDYRYAVGQGAGAVGQLGVEFEDFNAILAGSAAAFSSGSDAATSFKTFIQRTVPQTDKAAAAMEALNLEFYDAAGNLKGAEAIAQSLQDGLRGLSEEARNENLTTIFGSDAIRTALSLADLGAAGIERLKAAIADVSATEQAEARMKGWEGAVKQLKSAFEGLQLAIADSGLLQFVTDMANRLTEFTRGLSETNPALLKWGTIVAGVAAALGPVVLAVGAVALALSAISLPVAAGVAGAVALGGAFVAFGDQITAALGKAWAAISNTLGPPLAELATAAKAALDGLGEILRAIFGDEFIDSLGGAGGALETFFTTLAEFAGTQILANLSAALQLVSGAIEGWAEIFQAVADVIRGDFDGALQHLKNAATNAKDTLIRAFETMSEPVKEAVKAVADAIKEAFLKLPGQMLQIGKDIVQGLIDGIGSMASDAVAKVKSVGSGIIDGLRGILQIQSPSRVMHAIGQDVMAGLTNGMSAGSAGAVAVAEQTAARVNQAVAMAAAAQGQGLGATVSAEAKEATSGLNSLGNMGQQIASTIGNAFGSLIDGSKKVKDVVLDLLKQFGNMMLNNVFQAISGGASGTGGAAGIGSIFSGILGALPGFATGGSMSFGGGNNSMDNQLAAFRVSAGETVDIHRGDQGRPAPVVNVYNNFDPTEWDTHIAGVASPIARREADSARRDVPAISRAADREGRLRKTRTLQGRFA